MQFRTALALVALLALVQPCPAVSTSPKPAPRPAPTPAPAPRRTPSPTAPIVYDPDAMNVPGFVTLSVDPKADSPDNTWTTGVDYAAVLCPQNGKLSFTWTAGVHDLMMTSDKAAYDACDFADPSWSMVAGARAGAYTFDCASGGSFYFSCSVGSHCQNKQKVEVTVPEPSLTDNLPLTGHMTLAGAEALIQTKAYLTEPALTIERLWCVMPHCPVSAQDYLGGASNATCRAEVYNLLGFAHRKQPQPELEHSEEYYKAALELEPAHCGALGYLAELYVTLDRLQEATTQYTAMCDACGASHEAVAEVNQWYKDAGATIPDSPCASAVPAAAAPIDAPLDSSAARCAMYMAPLAVAFAASVLAL